MSLRLLIFTGVLIEICYLSFYFVDHSPTEILLFMGVFSMVFLLMVYVVYRSRSTSGAPSKHILAVILAFAILFRLTLVLHDPVASDDIYRYVWDGRVAMHGINPFAFAPTDPRLSDLHTSELPSKINFPDMRTIYPPLAQIFFLASNLIWADSVAGMKLMLVAVDILSVLMLILLLRRPETMPLRFGRHGSAQQELTVILYAWSPVPVMYFALDGHIDALGIPFLLLFLFLLFRNKWLVGVVSLGFATVAKLYPLFVTPFLYRIGDGVKRFVLMLIPVAMFGLGCWFYLEPTGGLYESLAVYSATWEFNGSVFKLLWAFLDSNRQAHLASGILFLLWVGWLSIINRTMLEKVFLGFVGFIMLAPVVHPWYLSWLAALVVIRWSPAVFVLLGLSVLSNIVVHQYRVTGVWQDIPLVLVLEYIPFYVLLLLEVLRQKIPTPAAGVTLRQSS